MEPELSDRLNTDWVTPQFNQKVKRKIPFRGEALSGKCIGFIPDMFIK